MTSAGKGKVEARASTRLRARWFVLARDVGVLLFVIFFLGGGEFSGQELTSLGVSGGIRALGFRVVCFFFRV